MTSTHPSTIFSLSNSVFAPVLPPLPPFMSIAVVSGVGPGTGRAVSLAFAALSGYSVALVGRDGEYMRQVAREISSGGGGGGSTSGSAPGSAAVFSLESYERKEVERVFREIQQSWPDKIVKAAVYNAARK